MDTSSPQHHTAASPPWKHKKLRVLCLHGFRTSADILKQQIEQRWGDSVLSLLDMIFTEYTGLEDTIDYISNFMYENGPFDGLLGFSQGAVLTAALVGLQQKGLALMNHPSLQFALVISGGMFKHPKWKQDCYSDIIKCPSLHFIGENDWLKAKSEELVKVFEHPCILRHKGKHSVPRLDQEATSRLRAFIEEMCPRDGNITKKCEENSAKDEFVGASELVQVTA